MSSNSLFSFDAHKDRGRVRRKGIAFLVSLAIHGFVVTVVAFIDLQFEQQANSATKYYAVMVPPKEESQKDKIIWYKAPETVPEIAPQKRIGTAESATGEIDPSRRTLIVQSEEHASTKQIIIEPAHPEPIPVDVPAPNLLAIHPEPTPKLPPKAFVPPSLSPTPSKPVEAALPEAPPQVSATPPQPSTSNLGALARLKITRPFVVPPAGAGKPAAAANGPTEMPAPPLLGGASSSAGVEAIIVGLNPAIGPPPQGSRSGQFAKAPAEGLPSSGAPANGATVVPGVASHGSPRVPAEPSAASAVPSSEKRVFKEVQLPSVNRTMSAPLRPSSRVIPASVESQFSNRNVYTLVIPRPDLAEYSGDWIMWFSDREPDPEARASVSAPVPNRKYSPVESLDAPKVAGTVQFAAVIDRTGHIASSKVLRSRAVPAFQVAALTELKSWEFKPALRNGEPIEVDVVLEIPFELHLAAEVSR